MKYFKNEISQEIIIKQEQFERDAQDLGIFTFSDFYISSIFKQRNKLENKDIKCNLRDL